jgi:hypothetical protein
VLVIYIRISQITIPCFLFRFWNKFEDCPGTETSWFLYYLLRCMVYNTSVKYIGPMFNKKKLQFLRIFAIVGHVDNLSRGCAQMSDARHLTCFVLVASQALFYKLASKSHLYELMNFAVDSLTPLSCRSSGVRHVKKSRTHWSALRLNG